MQFQSLKVERFGSLADFEVEFNADAPIQLLFGPNEAGKSTFLGLIRELLFGFPHSGSPYHYSAAGRQIAAEARLRMADHTTLHFRREKGTKHQQVQGQAEPSGETIDDASLLHRLGGVSQPFYENVFGFSLGELTSGEKSLEVANLDEALYGTGLGGLKGLQSIQSELADESDKFWLARGKKQKINHLLGKVKTASDSLRTSMLRPDEYEARLQRHRQASESLEKIRSENETSRRTLKHLERLRDSLGPYQELNITRRHLEKLEAEWKGSIDRFPAEGRRKMDDLMREIPTTEQSLAEIDRQIAETTVKIDSLACHPTLVEQEPGIRRLFQTLKQIHDYRDEIPASEQELDSIRRQVLATIHEIDPSWTIEVLEKYRVSLDRRTRIEEMADAWNQLQEQRAMNEERRLDRQKDLDTNLARREAIVSSSVESTELLAITERQSDYDSNRRRRHELEEQLEGLHWKAEEAARKLFCVPGLDHEGLDELNVPLEETVRRFAEQVDESEQTLRTSTERLRQAEEQLDQLKAKRDEVEAAGSAPTREQLEAARTLRDEGWQLLRRRYVESKKVAEKHFEKWIDAVNASRPTTQHGVTQEKANETESELYESTVRQTDRLADERQDKAELVVTLDSLSRRITAAERQRDECRQQAETAEGAQRELLVEWHTIWKPCEITPRSPEEMLRWLENYRVYLGLLGEVKTTEVKADSVDRQLNDFEEELRRTCLKSGLFPEEADAKNVPSTETLFATAKQRVDQYRETQAEQRALQNRLAELKSELKQLDQAIAELTNRADDWKKRWTSFLTESDLPSDWTPKMAAVTLGQLHDARREYQKIEPMEKRLTAIRTQVERFDRETHTLCRQVADDLNHLPPEQAVETLHARLEEAKGAAIEKRNAQENRQMALLQKTAVESQLAELRAARDVLLEAAGVESTQAFYEAADRADQHRALSSEIRNRTDQIDRFITTEEVADTFWKELQETDADTFELKLNQAREEDARISLARDQAAAEESLAAEALKALDQTDQTIRLAAELESYRSELRDAVDRWATLSVAQTLIDDAVRRFEREYQPEMMEDIRRLFAMMTADRYTEVRRRMNQQSTLVVIQKGGTEKVPAQLSTGTREQLYLAMRLAYVIHYCRRNEPLPLVMDDVLVNFDATRAAGTIDALAEVARSTQIIFLTCHKHTIDLIHSRLPTTPVCEIGSSVA